MAVTMSPNCSPHRRGGEQLDPRAVDAGDRHAGLSNHRKVAQRPTQHVRAGDDEIGPTHIASSTVEIGGAWPPHRRYNFGDGRLGADGAEVIANLNQRLARRNALCVFAQESAEEDAGRAQQGMILERDTGMFRIDYLKVESLNWRSFCLLGGHKPRGLVLHANPKPLP